MIAPNVIHIDVTGKCNLNCIHCRGRGEKDMTLDEIKLTLDKLQEVFKASIKWIEISGGEPFLREEVFDILEYIKKKFDWRIIIVSNGWFITKDTIKKLENIGVERVQISLDGAKEETHNRIRQNPLAYTKAIAAIRLISNSKIRSIVRMVINKYNYDEVEDFFKLCCDMDVDEIGIRCAVIAGNAKKNNLVLSIEKYAELMKKLPLFEKKYGVPYYSGDPLAIVLDRRHLTYLKENYKTLNCLAGCSIGGAYFYITNEGNICPCTNLQEIKLGHVLKDDILKIWNESEIFIKCRARNFKGACGKCKYKYVCGGCRVFAKLLDHNIYGTDIRCPFARAKNLQC